MEARKTIKMQARERSPGRSMVWRERSPKPLRPPMRSPPLHLCPPRKAAVVYYISRNRQLEHPHLIEVPLSASGNLFLRDVIERLNILRGKGMASLYAWSSKRSYKNGYVWQDLCEDDLIFPSHGNEYVLKGSELCSDSCAEPMAMDSTGIIKSECLKSSSLEDSSSCSSMNGKDTNSCHEANISPTEFRNSSVDSSFNVATQTDEEIVKSRLKLTGAKGVSTDDEDEGDNDNQDQVADTDEISDAIENSVTRPSSSSSASSSSGKTGTLGSLIRADLNKINSFRMLEEEAARIPAKPKIKAANLIMQLFTCGSMSAKDHNIFGITRSYRPSYSQFKFLPSPISSTSIMMGEFDCSSKRRMMGQRFQEKEFFSGSLIETKIPNEIGNENALRRSSSCDADRHCKHKDLPNSSKIEASTGDHPTNCIVSSKIESFRKETVTKVEERLSSGARVIIKSNAPIEDEPWCP